jgi:hypothetical protein
VAANFDEQQNSGLNIKAFCERQVSTCKHSALEKVIGSTEIKSQAERWLRLKRQSQNP